MAGASRGDGVRWAAAAVVVALFVAAAGAYPHGRFSAELGRPAWFYNSYDEGFYGWATLHAPILHRILAASVMRTLTALSGGSLERAMILADCVLPFLCALAACFAVRPLVRSPVSMAGSALFLLTVADAFAFRSSLGPFWRWFPTLERVLARIDPRPDGIFQTMNQTSSFWLFRTPEPQTSWILLFLLLGCFVRCVLRSDRRWLRLYAALSLLGAAGYLLVTLPLFGGLCFASLALLAIRHRSALWLFLWSLAGGIGSFAIGLVSAIGGGGSSLVFGSHRPVLLLSGIGGLVVAGIVGEISRRRRSASPLTMASIALSIAPLLMANQQLVTGRMLYLLNFENFVFPQLVGVAFLMLPAIVRESRPERRAEDAPIGRLATAIGACVAAFFAVALWSSQVNGYQEKLASNLELERYVQTIRSLSLAPTTPVLCEDVFVADTLPVQLGWHPNFVLSRDMVFSVAVDPLKAAGDVPKQRSEFEPRLFEALALVGTTPEQFARKLDAVVNPDDPDWRSRFVVGGFLYSHADFWAPLTQGRALKRDWIAAEKAALVDAYARFKASAAWPREPTVVIGTLASFDAVRSDATRAVDELTPRPATPGDAGVRAVRVHPPISPSVPNGEEGSPQRTETGGPAT